MSGYRSLTATAGQPFAQSIRVVDGKNVWATSDLFEFRAQLRVGKIRSTALIADLRQYMTVDYDVNDIVITWTMTGQQTRELYDLATQPKAKKGYFNIILSDVGLVDAKALVVPTIGLKVLDTTTEPEDP